MSLAADVAMGRQSAGVNTTTPAESEIADLNLNYVHP